jgi:GTP-binding protein
LKILNAEFVTSAQGLSGVLHDGLPQVAFAGRSNVGKSSLLNALCRRSIARTSAAPGKTRLVNVYRATLEGGPGGAGRWSLYLVDLPGYGYARGGEASRQELAEVAEAYLAQPERGDGVKPAGGRPPSESSRGWGPASTKKSRRVTGVLLLVDSRHPGLDSDRDAAEWLTGLNQDLVVVATKIDKLSRAERTHNLRELERIFGTAALPVSADSGEGLDALWQKIANLARR